MVYEFYLSKKKKKASNNLRRQSGENIGQINDKGIISLLHKEFLGYVKKNNINPII